MSAKHVRHPVAREPAEQAAGRFQKRQISFARSILFHAAPPRNQQPRKTSARTVEKFFGQGGLADTWFAGDENDSARSFERPAQELSESLQFRLASHKV